jgi:predicted flap endonuclease-1-like 5' DNA nuclease
MGYKIEEIEGIGPAHGKKLIDAGISSTDDLLRLCCDASGRKEISQKSGLSESQLLQWTNMADLMRIAGIGAEYSELLESAGVDTVKELRNRNPENLAAKLSEVNEQKKLTRMTPGVNAVTQWVEQAKKLEALITY